MCSIICSNCTNSQFNKLNNYGLSLAQERIKSKNEDNGYAFISCIALDSKNWSCVLRNWDK